MKHMGLSLKHATSMAVASLSLVIVPPLVSSEASAALPVIWPKDTSILSYLQYYDLEEHSCMQDAPDASIPNNVDAIDLKSTADYRVFNDKYLGKTKPGCNRFVVDFRVTKFTNIVFAPNATSKTFEPRGDAGLVDKFGNYGIKANLNNASDKDQCERMVVALTVGWKKWGWSDFKIVHSTVMPYAWTPSIGDPTKGTCAPGKEALQQQFPTPDSGYGKVPTVAATTDVYRVAIAAGQTKVKSDFSNPNPNVGNADSTRISHWLYNGKPIPQMAVLHRQDF